MSAPDLVTAHVTAGIPDIWEFWPGLTGQDVHTMNAWSYGALAVAKGRETMRDRP